MSKVVVALPPFMQAEGAIVQQNGLGGETVSAGETVSLYAGDKLRFGDAVLRFNGINADGNAACELYAESQARVPGVSGYSTQAEAEKEQQVA